MKNSAEKEMRIEVQADSDPQSKSIAIDPFDTSLMGFGIPNYKLEPKLLENIPPLVTPEQEDLLKDLHESQAGFPPTEVEVDLTEADLIDEAPDHKTWIQTYSGRRFSPLNPNVQDIAIEDIAHSLSMQCRFSGHCKRFYSVAQHSVLVSYICDSEDALWGLLHDASEAYLVDVPTPIKKSGRFDAYIEFERVMQKAICERFSLSVQEPLSVKMADTKLLATEALELMSPLHPDWIQLTTPLPFIIEPWDQEKAKRMFMLRFLELTP